MRTLSEYDTYWGCLDAIMYTLVCKCVVTQLQINHHCGMSKDKVETWHQVAYQGHSRVRCASRPMLPRMKEVERRHLYVFPLAMYRITHALLCKGDKRPI